MASANKYYVVWEGRAPGIYDNWEDARAQVDEYPGARFKAFSSQTAATLAFRGDPSEHTGILRSIAAHNAATTPHTRTSAPYAPPPGVITDAIAVDGACARNPGPMEYRGVSIADGTELFHVGPLDDGTNNVAEYLALIHALALLDRQHNTRTVVYSDSVNAISWVRRGGHRSQLARTPRNAVIHNMLARADAWLRAHPVHNAIHKWDTRHYGEIPADFGRK